MFPNQKDKHKGEKKENALNTNVYPNLQHKHGKYFSESVHENDKQFKFNPSKAFYSLWLPHVYKRFK